MENSRRRVVITGMGVMTALGETVQDYWDGLINGRSGIGPMTLCDPTGYPCKMGNAPMSCIARYCQCAA